MDLYAVRRIKSERLVGLIWARGFTSIEPDGLRAMVTPHANPDLCEAALVNIPLAFVGPTLAAGRVDFRKLTDWQPLKGDGITRPYLIRIMRKGKPYFYFRVGDSRTPLLGRPGDDEFERAYTLALNAETARRNGKNTL